MWTKKIIKFQNYLLVEGFDSHKIIKGFDFPIAPSNTTALASKYIIIIWYNAGGITNQTRESFHPISMAVFDDTSTLSLP